MFKKTNTKQRKLMRKVNALSAIVAVVITAAVSGVVASNAASSTIYACVSKTSSLTKVSTKPHTCPKGTLKLSWGTAGTKGATGAKGDQGVAGTQGYAGEQGPAGAQGPAGEQGPAGAQGPAGQDGSGLTMYSAHDFGQSKTLVPWSGTDTAYEITTTPQLPVGDYFVTATTGFRGGLGATACWINVDSQGHWGSIYLVDVEGENNTSVSGMVGINTPGTLSFSCYGDTGTTNFDTQLSAIKVSSVNPN
jgi:hypothetical protein